MITVVSTKISAELGAVAALLFVFMLVIMFSVRPVSAGLISESFPSETVLPEGTLVSINSLTPSTLVAASVRNADYLIGVVEEKENSLLAVDGLDTNINVATAGRVTTFVSDINGEITSGDFIGTSWIKGIGMKANTQSKQKLLGVAIENFVPTAEGNVEVSDVATPDGNKNVRIGKIAVQLFAREAGPDFGKEVTAVEEFANKIAGKEVAYSRVLAAIVLFLVSLVISGIFLANAIHGSFISLGRNPLSSSSVFTSLMQVSGVSISLVLIGSVLAYLVLII